jgi:uracil-DNA glycosylase family 4
MLLSEFPKEIQDVYLKKDFIAGWQNKAGKVQIMVVGIAPSVVGAAVNRKPLSDSSSGKILWRILKEVGLDNKIIYITNVVKYPLNNNRNPMDWEIQNGKITLHFEIEKYNPETIILLGRYANSIFGLSRFGKLALENSTVISIDHPGYYLRQPYKIQEAIDFLKKQNFK